MPILNPDDFKVADIDLARGGLHLGLHRPEGRSVHQPNLRSTIS